MRVKLSLFALMIMTAAACSLLSSGPSATVKKFMTAAQKGDSAAMTKLFSSKAVQKTGIDKIKSNNESFAEMNKRAYESDSSYSMNKMTETKTGDTARVSFFYQNQKRTDSIRLVFDLSKEKGEWKIDDIGGSEKEVSTSAAQPSPEPQASPTKSIESLEPPLSAPPPPRPQATQTPNRGPISGGVLNGKATSLPKPAYSPAARAVKASGAVNVEVLVDETGKVVTASAISGHPLLRAAAVSAAYSARFSPTRLAGQAVKIKGVIIYNFVPE